MSTTSIAPRIGARVLLLDPSNRVLLIHALDPCNPSHRWWELPGGGLDPGESLTDAARREVAEESGIVLAELGPQLWVRESRFRYKDQDHHRVDHVFLGRTCDIASKIALRPSDNEKMGLIERRWWGALELRLCVDELLPGSLPDLLDDVIAGCMPSTSPRLVG